LSADSRAHVYCDSDNSHDEQESYLAASVQIVDPQGVIAGLGDLIRVALH